ncbi:MAG: nucleotidyltransferase domain-containing protein [Candidatus Cloacimonetes bacterium]|nr:nucleotidyltransferase domain-containing protein [Candidatus Cloacimonadota bacterium]MCF7814315.1 nucleotidyltransferase domain-containing protein [Candidatus Cloacimonadota bacterium]MCF7868392.1 nucleotidyltransferase domain-containing protein [Candidatus Cloacimonadota bacterium]MCF7883843.1 nucleotidyltransferase domain-containing protein [Candidatus Cloacimonadota bacterium]
MKKNSDIDLALYLESDTSNTITLQIASNLEEEFHFSFDVINLKTANPILQHEVLRTGDRIIDKNSILRADFELESFRNYIDNSYFLRRRYAK